MSILDNLTPADAPAPDEFGESVDLKMVGIGDGVVGTMSRRALVETKYGPKTVFNFTNVLEAVSDGQPVAVPADQEATIWATPGVIKAIDAKSAGIGDKIGLKLVDLIDTDKGNPYKAFGCGVIERATPGVPTPTVAAAPTAAEAVRAAPSADDIFAA